MGLAVDSGNERKDRMRAKQSLQSIIDELPYTVGEMLERFSESFYDWQSENVQSGGYSSNTGRRDRYNRCHEAAEHGSDGSTHAECIDDFREFGRGLFDEASRQAFRLLDDEGDKAEDQIADKRDAFEADCDKLEAWHEANGSLNQQVG